jgi:hypothetical protein
MANSDRVGAATRGATISAPALWKRIRQSAQRLSTLTTAVPMYFCCEGGAWKCAAPIVCARNRTTAAKPAILRHQGRWFILALDPIATDTAPDSRLTLPSLIWSVKRFTSTTPYNELSQPRRTRSRRSGTQGTSLTQGSARRRRGDSRYNPITPTSGKESIRWGNPA